MKEKIRPMPQTKRLHWIDAARGAAILGIFMVNAPSFGSPYFMPGIDSPEWDSPLDTFLLGGIDIFFQASFYTLFSILFGFGMQLIFDSRKRDGIKPGWFLSRRMLVLLGLGAIHAFLIWHGDILFTYAIIGLLLIPFLYTPRWVLLTMIPVLIVPGLLFNLLSVWLASLADLDIGELMFNMSDIQSKLAAYGNGTYIDILQQNHMDWSTNSGVLGIISGIFTLLPLMMLGTYLARVKLFHDPVANRRKLIWFTVITGFLFLVFKAGPYLVGAPLWLTIIQDSIGGPASALFYLSVITLVANLPVFNWFARQLSYVGRMSLSNYLFQSVLMFVLFYGIGFGLYGEFSLLSFVCFVIGVFVIQVVLSRIWFRYFTFGPIEWLWRILTYGKIQPLRKKNEQRVS
ncbi:hypothetical protein CHH69_08960 [Terribacillus saccharophilus]|uniref:DUF418 domain-containing protein n=1 Tax=Terribacillus saccharophilus TaxID=361277 RepID=UPI000BA74457|nr:DUF418 domain-containing protein [Terribacillus saccharophilus]PAF21470.1 hypothetical protein CHH49_11270 [Terribacillus saccharophilus]PAF38117.1 hypothetical protein CHH69_08960 [Terribacillus saccharophilus]